MTREPDQPSRRVVQQRVHNRILEYLEVAASFDEQREYQSKAPISVPNEIINQWADWYDEERAQEYAAPAFSMAERAAMAEFHRVWNLVVDASPNPLPDLERTIQLAEWSSLRDAAKRALAVFSVRGRLPEDVEIAAP